MRETCLFSPVWLCNFRAPALFVTHADNSEVIILFAADGDHPFHRPPDSVSAAGPGSPLVVLASLLHGGKYEFLFF